MLDLGARGLEGDWRPPIVETIASKGDGTDELWSAIRSSSVEAPPGTTCRRRFEPASSGPVLVPESFAQDRD